MTYQPVLPLSGYTGWRFLQRTLDTQTKAFTQSAEIKRATEYFKDNIGKVRTADDLMKDRRLLDVALKAFGLDDDINNKAFIRKVLAEGTLKDDAFANRLSDKRYAEFARVFGFGDLGARTGLASFPDAIISRFNARQFEKAVGDQSNEMRLALNLGTGIKDVLANSSTSTGQWFGVMGSSPLRTVFETALGFSSSFGQIDLDQQLTAFKARARNVFGTDDLKAFADPALQEKLIRLYMVRSEAAAATGSSPASRALSLLQGGR
jgi:Protein of unknown function (DUF1217)